MNISIIPASVGKIALEIMAEPAQFSIRGITSRGVFVSVEGRVILFLSREKYRGPLIVNLLWKHPRLDQIDLSTTGEIINQGLQFNYLGIFINCPLASVWSTQDQHIATPLPAQNITDDQIYKFLRLVLSSAENELITGVAAAILPGLFPAPIIDSEVFSNIQLLLDSLRKQEFDNIEQFAHFFAGRGRGLTPSGDDFLLGLTYALYSHQDQLPAGYSQIIQPIVDTVRRRSTLISANLVECAALGEIDERLLAAYNALINPTLPPGEAINSILSWGSSSGLDATAGMALLLAAIR